MNEIEKYKSREYLVVKANDLIQKSRYSMSLVEQKTIAYLCSLIKPIKTDTGQEILYQLDYDFNITDYCDICGIEKDGRAYARIKTTLKALSDKSMWLQQGDTEVTVRWIEKVRISRKSGKIKIRLDADLIPYLFNLSQQFTQYQLICVLAMKSAYSLRLYELLRSYAYQREKVFEVEDLKVKLNATNYTRYPDFKRKVIEVAIKEICELTDLQVFAEPITGKNRKVEKIRFKIQAKNEEERIQTSYWVNDKLDYK